MSPAPHSLLIHSQIQEVHGSACLIDSDCPVDNLNHIGNGANTGKCIIQPGMSNGTCEIYSWCPLENDTLPLGSEHFMFPMVENFTLLIKNDVTFRKFNVHRRNIQHWVSKRFLRTCHYDKDHPEYKHCPIFKFSTMFKEANIDHSALIHGGVIGIDINWDCDLDWDKKYCVPEYKFSRLDDPDAPIGRGFNFRYAYYYYVDGVLHRDLIKAYGIRFQIHSTGTAGKFHILPLTMNIGSGIALLGLAPVICDIIILNLVGSKKIYQKAKFETIAEEQQLIAARRECKVKPGDLPKSSKKKKKVSTESDSHSQEHPESNANITPSGDQNVVP
ncbi:P2X purinoceptor 2 [Clonorchis sinensis]|uniref:p2X purinoceptor 5 n=2 Tax=Clonorchis sinensis TaxID=79923 RepID=H2KS16_CLOSI|nr:P2X purinoceptor 2 [Clonorchis sinensis]GAA27763.2 P2X purinoceptor 5 [Clonorchis sinensis]